MLLENFYTINTINRISDQSFLVEVKLNDKHEVFKGHFPGNPVTPGVGMMQIIKELTEEITGEKLFLSNASNVKFMALINPEATPDLKLELDILVAIKRLKSKTPLRLARLPL